MLGSYIRHQPTLQLLRICEIVCQSRLARAYGNFRSSYCSSVSCVCRVRETAASSVLGRQVSEYKSAIGGVPDALRVRLGLHADRERHGRKLRIADDDGPGMLHPLMSAWGQKRSYLVARQELVLPHKWT